MVRIQILFLYTSIKNLIPEHREKVRSIVVDEYCNVFKRTPKEVTAALADAYSTTNKKDIILSVQTDQHVMNEAVLCGNMKDSICSRLSLLSYMKATGFKGVIGIQNGEVKEEANAAQVSENKNENTATNNSDKPGDDNSDYRMRAKQYSAEEAKYSFHMLQIPENTLAQIERALARIEYEQKVFKDWGLHAIMPSPVSALSFYGPPGTGKSLAADAIASKLGKKIIRASYADIENKYVGEGPKNVGAIFLAAEEQEAILFIDEADSLLSKRMVNVTEPSGQAMNSMRSQLLISLERFHGIVIFATNLAVNYDRAFVSRLINVKFEMPDAAMREKIWAAHLPLHKGTNKKLNFNLDDDVDLAALSNDFILCGRDIRTAVVDACVEACRNHMNVITQKCLRDAAAAVFTSNQEITQSQDQTDIYSHECKDKKGDAIPPELSQKMVEVVKSIVDDKDGAAEHNLTEA